LYPEFEADILASSACTFAGDAVKFRQLSASLSESFLVVYAKHVLVYWSVYHSDSDSDSGPPQGRKEYVFSNKKDAVDAFKNLLREKVSILFAITFSAY